MYVCMYIYIYMYTSIHTIGTSYTFPTAHTQSHTHTYAYTYGLHTHSRHLSYYSNGEDAAHRETAPRLGHKYTLRHASHRRSQRQIRRRELCNICVYMYVHVYACM